MQSLRYSVENLYALRVQPKLGLGMKNEFIRGVSYLHNIRPFERNSYTKSLEFTLDPRAYSAKLILVVIKHIYENIL